MTDEFCEPLYEFCLVESQPDSLLCIACRPSITFWPEQLNTVCCKWCTQRRLKLVLVENIQELRNCGETVTVNVATVLEDAAVIQVGSAPVGSNYEGWVAFGDTHAPIVCGKICRYFYESTLSKLLQGLSICGVKV